MPTSTNVNAGDPIKASQYNSLITDMTTIENDMTALETSVNNSIANLEAQTELLALQPTVSLHNINWYTSAFYYNYTNNSAISQYNGHGQLQAREDNGLTSGAWGGDTFASIKGSNAFVWEMSTTLNSGCTTQVVWGIADSHGAWNNAIQLGMQGNQSYGYTIFRYTGIDGKLWAVTRASSSDTEEATDLGLVSGLSGYAGGMFQLRIHKDNFTHNNRKMFYLEYKNWISLQDFGNLKYGSDIRALSSEIRSLDIVPISCQSFSTSSIFAILIICLSVLSDSRRILKVGTSFH